MAMIQAGFVFKSPAWAYPSDLPQLPSPVCLLCHRPAWFAPIVLRTAMHKLLQPPLPMIGLSTMGSTCVLGSKREEKRI